MLDNYLTDDEATWSDIYVVLRTNAKITTYIACDQRESFKKNTIYKETVSYS